MRPVRKFFVLRHTSLQNNVNGGVEPWSLVTKGRTLKENPECRKYFCQKYFHQKYFHQKYFSKKYFLKKYFRKKYFHQKYFPKKKSPKMFLKKYVCQIFFQKKGGGEVPLLPAGPRLISSDSEISA